ncbi:cytochrome P450 [Halioglobus maricola]|uniref:Cytochrome P450 n=1 Tax=Halioglobus maricola TaxID=2601894 RepID=A0A5P9NLW6_9GAMM|nr:cytochrome P450 [Halioglobus maricola]QFU76619.1 cytochrome P450 [Halioglobus maricola]
MEFSVPDYVHHRDNKNLDHIPGRYGLPFVGDTFRFVLKPFETLDQRYREYGPVSKISMTFQKMVVALGPEFVQQLTLDSSQSFSAQMGWDGPLGDFFAGGLLMKDFAEHKFHRRIMQTAFKVDAMRQYVDIMNPIIDEQVAGWSDVEGFHFYPNVKTLLLDVGAKVFLGLDMEGEETRTLNQAFLDLNEGPLALIRKDWPGLQYRKGMDGRRALERYFTELAPRRRGQTGTDMATFFANEKSEDGEYFSDKVVGDHLIFLLLAAHDTTTSALTMASYYLANDQAWQDRLREEVATLGRQGLSYDDLGSNVTDLDHCFKETLRLNPPVPMYQRRTVKEVELGGYTLAPHTLVQTSPLYTMRMKEWWQDPHSFDPDRFARNEHKQHSFLWAPFGGGAHKCIGLHFADMLFKCTMAQVLTRYRIRFAKEGQFPAKIQHFPFAKPMDDLPLVLEPLS